MAPTLGGGVFALTVEGFAELDRMLAELPAAVGKRVVREALVEAAAPMVEAMRAGAPVGPGRRKKHLRDTIEVSTQLSRRQRRGRVKDPAAVDVFVGSTYPSAHLVEFGTAPHAIDVAAPKSKAARANPSPVLANPETVFGPRVQHPGAAAHPFMRPAWDAHKRRLLDDFGKRLWAKLERAVRRRARRARRAG